MCKGRQGKLFRLSADQCFMEEVEDQEIVEVNDENASTLVGEVQTHAFEGHNSSNTIRLNGDP